VPIVSATAVCDRKVSGGSEADIWLGRFGDGSSDIPRGDSRRSFGGRLPQCRRAWGLPRLWERAVRDIGAGRARCGCPVADT
jgi:hypothetical protein